MRVRRIFVALLACAALLMAAACGGGGKMPLGDENEDPLFQQALDLKNQGRNGEALPAFLKVIDRRGEGGAPESHLEAGLLYLNFTKDPVEAYHHFRKYLQLAPNSKQAPLVRGKCDEAKLQFARTLPGRPLDDQSVRLEANDQIEQLRRENEELRAELQTLRGGAAPFARAPRAIPLPEERATPSSGLDFPGGAPRPATAAPIIPIDDQGSTASSPFTRSWSQPPVASRPAPPVSAPSATPPTRPAAGSRAAPTPPASAASAARRTHTVAPREGLWAIARRYYGATANQAKVDAIYEANRNVMSSPTDLKPGMVLKIP